MGMYIYVEEVNLDSSGELEELHVGEAERAEMFDGLSDQSLFSWVVFVHVRPHVIRINDLKLFTHIPNKQLKCGRLMCGLA